MLNSALIEELERQFSENPRRVFARLANEYRKSGNLEGAIALCREHVPKHPGYISGYIVLGQALFEHGELIEARGSFESALQLDPENLIALRHLGDIALQNGSHDEARAWYRRLLEVDPQNEEAAAQLESMETESVSSAADESDPAAIALEPAAEPEEATGEPAAISWSDIHPDSGSHPAVERHEGGVESAGGQPDESFPPARTSDQDAGAASDVAASASMEEQASGGASTTWQQGEAHEDTATGDRSGEDASDFRAGEIVPERDPFETADRDEPVQFALPREEIADVQELAQSPQREWSTERSGESREPDVQRWPGERASARAEDPTVAGEHEASSAGDQLGGAGAASTAGAPPAGEVGGQTGSPFMTETVAELYERQGHLNRSLEVYRQLASQNPDNAALRMHVERLERELTSAAPAAGESIRALFQRIVARRVPGNPAPRASNPLFPGASIPAEDDRAASALAGAFSPEYANGPAGGSGRPARAADDELSLDAVFGETSTHGSSHHQESTTEPKAAPEQGGEGVSFDEFFPGAGGAGGGTDEQAGGRSGEKSSGDDELFHSWLDGLKR